MPRILRIINRLNLGGPTYNAALLTRYLAPEFETLLIAGEKQETEESSDFIVRNLGIDYRLLPEMKRELSFGDDRRAYRRLREIIREFRPDIVHTHAAKPGTVGRLAALHEKVPVIVHTFHGHVFHSYFGRLKTRFFLEIERYLAKRSTAIIAISNKQKEELAQTYRLCPPEKIRVIPLGFDLSRFQEGQDEKRKQFRSRYGVKENEVAIGVIGRLVPVKNHRLFLATAHELVTQGGPPLRFFVIGDGEERDGLLQFSASLGLDTAYFPKEARPAQVIFTSWMKEADVAVAGLDVVALTSFNEGTPVSLVEAQAGERPVVSTLAGGVENVVEEGQTGFLCPNGDAVCLGERLARLAADPALRREMGHRGWGHVRDRYHYTRLISDTRDLYNDLLLNSAKNRAK
jgi:glycosyltransferase involved in cell wall biosynthesis